MAGLLQNLLGVFSFLAILILSFASSRATQIEILNNCTYTIWAAAYPGGGRQLKHGEKWTLKNVTGSGRIWGRTKCAFGRDGRGKCESGDCNRRLECQSHGRAPNTVAEYSLNGTQFDVIHISVVEGFNIPMEVRSIGSAIADASLNCNLLSRCAADVNGPCPMELRDPEGCNNPCTVFGNSQFCCTSESSICQPTSYSMFFMALCLNALTYPSDLKQSSCPPGTNYKAVFCPSTIDKSQRATPMPFLSMSNSSRAQEFYEPHDFLLRHNNARAEVGVMALTWNTTLESYAREYANKRIGDCSLVHSGGPYGENLAWSSGNLSSSNAVEMWVHEKANYDYNSNSCAPNRACGHYTQVVWRNTVNLGCARVQCYNNMGTFIICTYSPPGNYIAQRPY